MNRYHSQIVILFIKKYVKEFKKSHFKNFKKAGSNVFVGEQCVRLMVAERL